MGCGPQVLLRVAEEAAGKGHIASIRLDSALNEQYLQSVAAQGEDDEVHGH